jgi:hypothetical protein
MQVSFAEALSSVVIGSTLNHASVLRGGSQVSAPGQQPTYIMSVSFAEALRSVLLGSLHHASVLCRGSQISGSRQQLKGAQV